MAWLAAMLCAIVVVCRAGELPPHPIVAYDDSWNDTATPSVADSALATLPAYIAIVDLAFARPDLGYQGNLDLSQTGLQYRVPGWFLRDAIALLHARNPASRVLLSIGGAAYTNWRGLNEAAIARLVADLHLDGVDIDFEPKDPGCGLGPDQLVRCATDDRWPQIVQRLRAALPRPAMLTAAVWSVGAYGEGDFGNAQPHSPYTGVMLRFLHSPTAALLDLLSIDAYDAGPEFRPLEAYRAYRAVWPGPLAVGLAVRRRGGSGPFFDEYDAELLARQVGHDPLGGMMVYPLLAAPDGARSDTLPDGRGLARAMCRGMGLTGCDDGR